MGLYGEHVRPRLLDLSLRDGVTGHLRQRVCTGLRGEVLEIGYGSGLNQAHLPAEVVRVSAVDPSTVAFRLSARRRAASAVPVVVVGDDAQDIPLPEDSVDAALSTWNLCGLADPAAALREVRRVLRPGGLLHFIEHGLAPDEKVARSQRRASAINKRIAGCVLDRDIARLLEDSELELVSLTTYYEEKAPKPAGYFYEGRARA